jgi:hypothetical protein
VDTTRIPPAGDPFTSAGSLAHPSTAESSVKRSSRAERALALYRERGHLIHRFGTGLYRVPSCSEEGSYYTVDYLDETCTCRDFEFGHGRACKHILAVGVSVARRRGDTARRLDALEERLAHELMGDDERLELHERILRIQRRLRFGLSR